MRIYYVALNWKTGFFSGLWHTATYIHQIAICDNTCVSVYKRTGPSSRHHWWPRIEKQSCSGDAKDTSRINHRMKRKQEIGEIWPQNRPWNSLRYPRKRPRGANCVGNEKEQIGRELLGAFWTQIGPQNWTKKKQEADPQTATKMW